MSELNTFCTFVHVNVEQLALGLMWPLQELWEFFTDGSWPMVAISRLVSKGVIQTVVL